MQGGPDMILTGDEIRVQMNLGHIVIEPFNVAQLNPNSYNLKLSPILKVYTENVLDVRKENPTETIEIPESGFLLLPGGLYLGSTVEWTETKIHAPMLEGRSSLGRLGVSVHVTAGFGDIGFKGNWTLEITVEKPTIIVPYIEICQICYMLACGKIGATYNGKYQGDTVPEGSRIFTEIQSGGHSMDGKRKQG
jgi:dCTP deaminase